MQKLLQLLLSVLLRFLSQPWSPRFFYAAKMKFCMTAIEVAVMREQNGRTQILLTERPASDKDWPRQMHSPGSMLRDTDADDSRSYWKVYRRVLAEIGVPGFSREPVLVDAFPTPTRRGPENLLVFIAEISGEPGIGRFYNLEEVLAMPTGVPGGIILEQVHMLRRLDALFRTIYPVLKQFRSGL